MWTLCKCVHFSCTFQHSQSKTSFLPLSFFVLDIISPLYNFCIPFFQRFNHDSICRLDVLWKGKQCHYSWFWLRQLRHLQEGEVTQHFSQYIQYSPEKAIGQNFVDGTGIFFMDLSVTTKRAVVKLSTFENNRWKVILWLFIHINMSSQSH